MGSGWSSRCCRLDIRLILMNYEDITMIVEVDSVKSYVYYNAETYVSIALLKQLVAAFLFISAYPFTCMIIGKALPWCALLLCVTFIYSIVVFVFSKKCNTFNSFSFRFFVNGFVSLVISIYFLLLSYNIMYFYDFNIVIYIVVLVCVISFGSLFIFYTVVRVKRNAYSKKKRVKKYNIRMYCTIGAIFGVILIRVVRCAAIDEIEIKLAILSTYTVSLISVAGITNLLKYYYAKRYLINSDMNGNNESPLLIQYPTSKKEFCKKVSLYLLILIFYVLIFVGVLIELNVI